MKNSNVSFTSKINFIPQNKFRKIYKSIDREFIVDEPWTLTDSKFSNTMLATAGINTCTSATIAKDGGAFMMHLTSCLDENFKNLELFAERFKDLLTKENLTSSIIIGSKSPKTPAIDIEYAPSVPKEKLFDFDSEKLFEKFKNLLYDIKPTLFEGHSNPNTGTNYIYDVKNDTYYINTLLDMFHPKSHVKNWDDLNKAFDKIQISPRDIVEFTA